MTSRESWLARRWTARRVSNGLDPVAPSGQPQPVMLAGAMQLLSDYEDAIYASCRHAVVYEKPSDEPGHMVEAVRLHADVRRLRLEVLDLMEMTNETLGEAVPGSDDR